MNDIDTLVGGDWNMNFIFPYIGDFIIPTDFHIFRRVETTNQISHVPLKSAILGYPAIPSFQRKPYTEYDNLA